MSMPVSQAARCAVVFFALAMAGAAGAADTPPASTETPEQALSRLLDANKQTLTISRDGLGGPGAATLLAPARTAQFILVGEDHGFAETPEFVDALRRSLGNDAPENLVLEIGPESARRVTQAARSDKLRELAVDYPMAIPFLNLREDGAMTSAWLQGSPRAALWGLDQEFLFSARLVLERLRTLVKPGEQQALVDAWIARAVASERKAMQDHDVPAALLLQLQDADFAALRAGLKPAAGSEAARLIDELAESTQIYHGQSADGYASNDQRGRLMKRHFIGYYRAAEKPGKPLPRALLRFGAYHMMRGITPTNLYDIGNFVSEFAASNDRRSLHLLILFADGTANRWMPFTADAGMKTQKYDARAEMEDFGAATFLDHAPAEGAVVFDLDPLRRQRKARRSAGPDFERVVFSYDYVIVMAKGRAGTSFE